MTHDRGLKIRGRDSQARAHVASAPQRRTRARIGAKVSGAQPSIETSGLFAMPFVPGATINGKYEVLELIGHGGVGFVVSARHVRLDDRVALKFLRPEFRDHEEAVRRFTVEARANFRIKSDHVVRLYDVDALPDGTPFIVMELLEGMDLGRVIETQGALPVDLALECTLHACEALAAAHASQVIHRDVKPENLFLTSSGPNGRSLKMLDFGISKLALSGGSNGLPETMVVGSPPYMSPEQLRGSGETDVRTDIWSLGCVLYELVTGRGPFMRDSLQETFSAVRDATPLPLAQLCPHAPVGLEAVILRCLEKDPGLRYADVAELALALAPFTPEAHAVAARCRHVLANAGRASTPTPTPTPTPIPTLAPAAPVAAPRAQTSISVTWPAGFDEKARMTRLRYTVLAAAALCGFGLTFAFMRAAQPAEPPRAAVHVEAASAVVSPASVAAAESAPESAPEIEAPAATPEPESSPPIATPQAQRPKLRKLAVAAPKPVRVRRAPAAKNAGDDIDVGF